MVPAGFARGSCLGDQSRKETQVQLFQLAGIGREKILGEIVQIREKVFLTEGFELLNQFCGNHVGRRIKIGRRLVRIVRGSPSVGKVKVAVESGREQLSGERERVRGEVVRFS